MSSIKKLQHLILRVLNWMKFHCYFFFYCTSVLLTTCPKGICVRPVIKIHSTNLYLMSDFLKHSCFLGLYLFFFLSE